MTLQDAEQVVSFDGHNTCAKHGKAVWVSGLLPVWNSLFRWHMNTHTTIVQSGWSNFRQLSAVEILLTHQSDT